MNKSISRCIFISAFAACITISVSAPWVLSDQNTFLDSFVNHNFLNLLGVIVAITLASAANLHLEFNKIEDLAKKSILPRTREKVKKSAMWLIVMFWIGFLVVITKPLLPASEIAIALVNGSAILIVLFYILVLIDLTQLVFRIDPIFKMLPNENEEQ